MYLPPNIKSHKSSSAINYILDVTPQSQTKSTSAEVTLDITMCPMMHCETVLSTQTLIMTQIISAFTDCASLKKALKFPSHLRELRYFNSSTLDLQIFSE